MLGEAVGAGRGVLCLRFVCQRHSVVARGAAGVQPLTAAPVMLGEPKKAPRFPRMPPRVGGVAVGAWMCGVTEACLVLSEVGAGSNPVASTVGMAWRRLERMTGSIPVHPTSCRFSGRR